MMKTLEQEIRSALLEVGGTVLPGTGCLAGRLDETVMAFWLDLIGVLRRINAAFAVADKELFGRVCLVRYEPVRPDEEMASILRSLANEECPTGIWCDRQVSASLAGFAAFGPGDDWLPLSTFASLSTLAPAQSYWERERVTENVLQLLPDKRGQGAILLSGPPFSGKRQALRALLQTRLGSFPVFLVRFGVGGTSYACIADAVSDELMAMLDGRGDETWIRSEPDRTRLLATAQARRFSNEFPQAFLDDFMAFMVGLIKLYSLAARSANVACVFAFEQVHLADTRLVSLLVEACRDLLQSGDATVLMTATNADAIKPWRDCSPKIARFEGPSAADIESIARTCRSENGEVIVDQKFLSFCSQQSASGGLAAVYRSAIGWEQTRDALPKNLHPSCAKDILEMGYATYLFLRCFPRSGLIHLFLRKHKSRTSVELAFSALAALGLTLSEQDPETAVHDMPALAKRFLGERAAMIRGMVREVLVEEVAAKRLRPSYGLLCVLHELDGEADNDLSLDAIESELDWGTLNSMRSALADGSFSQVVGTSRVKILAYIVRVRAALCSTIEDEQSLAHLELAFSAACPQEFPSPRLQAATLLDLSSYSYSRSSIPEAALRAKDAMLLLQDLPRGKGLSRAYRQLALVELSRERLSECMDYLRFAVESAETQEESFALLLDEVYSSIAQLLWGNLTLAEEFANRARTRSDTTYSAAWERWIRFLLGRIRFESGRYRDAAFIFQTLFDSCRQSEDTQQWSTLRAWLYRSRIYAHENRLELPADAETEGDMGLVLLEDAYFSGRFQEGIELAEALLAREISPQFASPERPDWTSGFSMMENRCIQGESVRKKVIIAYRALCLCERGMKDEAVEILRSLVKEGRLSELDPNDSFYFRAYRKALKAIQAPAVDQGTILSLAFKRLQRRASRIENSETKRAWFAMHVWNAELFADAKANNLI